MESLVPRLLKDIGPRVDQRLDDCTHDWIAEHVEKKVEEQYDSARASLELLRDELESSIREHMVNTVQEDLSAVVSEQLPDIVYDKLEDAVVSVVERSSFTLHPPH